MTECIKKKIFLGLMEGNFSQAWTPKEHVKKTMSWSAHCEYLREM